MSEDAIGREGWAKVSLSAYSSRLAQDLVGRLPRSRPDKKLRELAHVEFNGDDPSLGSQLKALEHYLSQHQTELLNLREEAEFELRISWLPKDPSESLVVPAQLLRSLAELDIDIMLDGYGS